VNLSDDWALNDEAIRNLGYMQMKKTHDAAIVIFDVTRGVSGRKPWTTKQCRSES